MEFCPGDVSEIRIGGHDKLQDVVCRIIEAWAFKSVVNAGLAAGKNEREIGDLRAFSSYPNLVKGIIELSKGSSRSWTVHRPMSC